MPLGPFSFILIFLSCHSPVRLKPELAAAGNAMGRMTASFGLFRSAVGRPEGAGTNQPGAE